MTSFPAGNNSSLFRFVPLLRKGHHFVFLTRKRLKSKSKVQTDHHIEARRPDLIIVDKEKKICQIVDFAIPGDHRVEMKEREKREKYQDLARELKVPWNKKVTVSPIVVGWGFGNSPKVIENKIRPNRNPNKN